MKRERRGPTAGAAGTLLASLLLVIGSSAGDARALTDEEIFRDFRFNFVNPGARSLGMGGAFIATGDDATAAQANPAALNYVFRSEFFAEWRQTRPDTLVSPSESFGDISDVNNPVLPFLRADAVNNPKDQSVPTFVSFAYPFRIGQRRARLAVSRQVLLKTESSLSDGAFKTKLQFAGPDYPVWVNPGNGCGSAGVAEQYTVCNSVAGNLDTELVHYNLAFSYALTNDFSVGVTATYANLDMKSDVLSTSQDPRGQLVSLHPRVTTSFGLSDIRTRTSIDDSDGAFAYTIGLHWHPDSSFPNRDGISPIRFGLVYRKGADLSVQETTAALDPNTGLPLTGSAFTKTFANTLREPDRYGLGISYHNAWNHMTFAVDVERIEYSDLLKDYQTGINFFTSGLVQFTGTPTTFSNLKFTVDDATVIHGGVEYSLDRGGWSFALRAGYFNSPDNRIRLERANSGDPVIDNLLKDVFRGGDDVNHYTVGYSVGAPKGIAVHLAVDFSDIGDEYLASAIYRFGKGR